LLKITDKLSQSISQFYELTINQISQSIALKIKMWR